MRRRLFRLATVLVAGVAAGVAAAPASAHPDPAGEFLTTQKVFVSYDAHLSSAAKSRLQSAVASAIKQGFPIRVALIWTRADLGKVPKYWEKPNAYAAFMYGENAYYFKGARLLVAMPSGFGFAWQKHSTEPSDRILSQVRVEGGAPALADATVAAVQRLAAADGVHVTAAAGSNQDNRDRVKILIGAAILLLAAWLARRARRPRLTVQRP
jgi:hypothetical protein